MNWESLKHLAKNAVRVSYKSSKLNQVSIIYQEKAEPVLFSDIVKETAKFRKKKLDESAVSSDLFDSKKNEVQTATAIVDDDNFGFTQEGKITLAQHSLGKRLACNFKLEPSLIRHFSNLFAMFLHFNLLKNEKDICI